MPSFRARFFLFVLQHAQLLRFQLKRKPFDGSPEGLEKLRKQAGSPSGLFGKVPKNVDIETIMINGRTAEWIQPQNLSSGKTILYFHGGMYVCGSPQGHRNHVAKFVLGSGAPALVFDYRLAPEHPFPAGLNDAIAAYKYLLESVDPSNIVFVGDSAGGGLCLATLLAIKDEKMPLPKGAVAMSPWTDLKRTGKSYEENEQTCLSPIGCAETCSQFYAGNEALDNPLVSPLYGDLSGLPPIRLYVGSAEILLDDSKSFARKAKGVGVDVQLTIGDGLFHCYPVCAPIFPEATEAMKKICQFVREV